MTPAPRHRLYMRSSSNPAGVWSALWGVGPSRQVQLLLHLESNSQWHPTPLKHKTYLACVPGSEPLLSLVVGAEVMLSTLGLGMAA